MKLNLNCDNSGYLDILNKITGVASDYFKFPAALELDLTFMDAKEIKTINKEQRNLNEPTDVLSFPNLNLKYGEIILSEHKHDINPETNNLMLGEIVICLDIAKKQADEFNHSLTREICYLYIHGLLHLFGFDHINDTDKTVMREHEENILKVMNLGR